MKLFALIVLLLFYSSTILGQNFWGTNTISSTSNEAVDVEVDAAGNQYVAGYFSGATTFSATSFSISTNGNNDVYVSKYNASGDLIWVKKFGGTFSDKPTDLTIDGAGFIYVTGQYFGTVAFGSTVLTSTSGTKDIFIVKLDNSGNIIWAISQGGTGTENAFGITTDSQNNVLLTGQFLGSSVIAGQTLNSLFDPSLGAQNFDLFVSKYSSAGTSIWVKTGKAKNAEIGFAIDCDANDNVYITGQFSDTMVFTGVTIPNISYDVGFLTKLSPTGTLLWFNKFKAGGVEPLDLEVASNGQAVVSGDFWGTINYITNTSTTTFSNPYDKKIFVVKTLSNGEPVWSKTYGSRNEISSRSISVDATKNVFITGYFKCDFSQFHDLATATYNSAGFNDVYLIKLDSTGQTVYAKQIGGKKNDLGLGVAILNDQKPTVCGSFTENLNIPFAFGYPYTITATNFSLNNTFAPIVMLNGDQTANSFLTNAIHAATPDYNFFIGSNVDSLFGFIEPNSDSIDFCASNLLYYNTRTYSNYGPDYDYIWSNGSLDDTANINTTGWVTVTVSREDGCVQGMDSIYATAHTAPPFPLLSDNLGIAVNTLYYPQYQFCAPDSVGVSFSNLCSGCSIAIGNPVLFTDTLEHSYSQSGIYYVTISDSFCSNTSFFKIDLDEVLPYDTIQPYIFFPQDIDQNDTITICNDQLINIHIYDFFTNPTHIPDSFNLQPTGYDNLQPETGNVYTSFNSFNYLASANNSGWYVYNYSVGVGYINSCGIDTTTYFATDSIYINVNSFSIDASDLLCPGGSIYLFVDTSLMSFTWSGPGIDWTSSANDSIQVSYSGLYQFSGVLTDTINGCVGNSTIDYFVNEKVPPIVTMFPFDGTICQGDSVYMSVPNTYTSYNWVDENGFSLSTTNEIYASDQGAYFCYVTDSSGCSLTTLVANVVQFAPAFLSANPAAAICDTETITITLNYSGNPYFYWQNPASAGFADQITVNQPGVYVCLIDQCGDLFFDSIEIFDGAFSVNLTIDDTLLCYSETAIINADPGYPTYAWNTTSVNNDSITASAAGDYFVTVTNQYGCTVNSDTVSIQVVPFSNPPAIQDTMVCPGADIFLSDGLGTTINWYDVSQNLVSSNVAFNILNLQSDSTVLAAYDVMGCSPAFQTIAISVAPPLNIAQIVGDTIACLGDELSLSIDMQVANLQWYLDGVPFSTDSLFIVSSSSTAQIVTVDISNICYTNFLSQTVYAYPISPISILEDSLLLCGDQLVDLEAIGNMNNFTWTGNQGNSVGNIIQVNASIGNGFLYVQGVDLNGCPSNRDSIWLETSTLDFTLSSDNFNCFGDSASIFFNTSSAGILWSGLNFSTTNNFIPIAVDSSTIGWFTVQALDPTGCIYTDSIQLSLSALPTIQLTNDTLMCLNDWLSYSGTSSSVSYTWQGLNPGDNLLIQGNSWYLLIATNQDGCAVYDSIYVETINCSNSLPNVFSPNGDGVNEFYVIDEALLFPNNEILVVNRWGNVVYQAKGYKNNWNGDNLVDGVYFVVFVHDTTDPNSAKFNSFVHIVR
ncbi:MAG: gliding motility-associated C-terminal domain-containing protein [Crocinitomicaceae bacterium]